MRPIDSSWTAALGAALLLFGCGSSGDPEPAASDVQSTVDEGGLEEVEAAELPGGGDPQPEPDCACEGRVCGDDGCGGSCGACGEGQECSDAGICVAVCTPFCENKECGDDGCGGSCGECDDDLVCAGGLCRPGCQPYCPALVPCGDDGCGGSCGECDGQQSCVGGECVEAGTCKEALLTCVPPGMLPLSSDDICLFFDAYPTCLQVILAAFEETGCESKCTGLPVPGFAEACKEPDCQELLSLAGELLGMELCTGCVD